MAMPNHPDQIPLDAVDAIIFDCDGTLVDTRALYHRAYDEAVSPFAVPPNAFV